MEKLSAREIKMNEVNKALQTINKLTKALEVIKEFYKLEEKYDEALGNLIEFRFCNFEDSLEIIDKPDNWLVDEEE